MRSEIDHHLLLSSSEDKRIGESGKARTNFDGTATSVVHDTVVECPSIDIPCPASDGTVDKSGPEEKENHHW